ncbi:MAG TPA: DUF5667 domain-containing protein [Candidatus Saccharimonadales bacterium]|nr:DUF5667 domain-containing protein [Candidatus Saccharimonadales bacterium]
MKLNKKSVTRPVKLITIVIISAIFVSGMATVAFASNGSKPGDALYNVDKASEFVREIFVFGDEANIKFKLAQATERLEELEALRNDNASQDRVNIAADNYGAAISEAASRLAEIAQNGGDIDEALASLVAEATAIHLDTLAKVYENVPEQAKDSIERAMANSEQGIEKSLEALNGSVSEEKRQQVEEKVQNSKELRGQPEDLPTSQQEAGGVERGQASAPTSRSPQ